MARKKLNCHQGKWVKVWAWDWQIFWIYFFTVILIFLIVGFFINSWKDKQILMLIALPVALFIGFISQCEGSATKEKWVKLER